MADDKKVKRQALALLKKARAWFKSEDRLVKDWSHMAEDADGNETAVQNVLACRRCIVGGAYVDGPDVRVAGIAHGALLKSKGSVDLYRPHSLLVVRRLYDRAIARLSKELANG